jgi:hypothetical protein
VNSRPSKVDPNSAVAVSTLHALAGNDVLIPGCDTVAVYLSMELSTILDTTYLHTAT